MRNPERLTKKIKIWVDTPTSPNEFGESNVAATLFRDCWAEIKPLSGEELYRAQQVQPKVTHEIHIRYKAGLTHEHYVVFKGRVLNIRGIVNVDERSEEQILMCEEKQLNPPATADTVWQSQMQGGPVSQSRA